MEFFKVDCLAFIIRKVVDYLIISLLFSMLYHPIPVSVGFTVFFLKIL